MTKTTGFIGYMMSILIILDDAYWQLQFACFCLCSTIQWTGNNGLSAADSRRASVYIMIRRCITSTDCTDRIAVISVCWLHVVVYSVALL